MLMLEFCSCDLRQDVAAKQQTIKTALDIFIFDSRTLTSLQMVVGYYARCGGMDACESKLKNAGACIREGPADVLMINALVSDISRLKVCDTREELVVLCSAPGF